jgi:hypothetical protein
MLVGMQLSFGPITSILTSCAAVAGAGIVLGGLVAGLVDAFRRRPERRIDSRVRDAGYVGGAMSLVALAIEQTLS